MPALEPVVATLIANTTEFTAAMDDAKLKMDSVAASGAEAGEAGNLLGDGLGAGAVVASDGLRDTEDAAKDAKVAIKDSGTELNFLGNILGGIGGPLGEAGNKTKDFSRAARDAGEKSNGFLSVLSDIPTPALVAGAAIAAVGAVTVDLASKYQSVTDKIAASEGISTKAATAVGNAFLKTAGQTTLSAQQIGAAFSSVAGQAKAVNGGALTAKQSLDLMTAAMNAAEGSGQSLSSTTSAVVSTLQTFSLGIGQAAHVSDILYSAANTTGQSISTFSSQLARTKSTLGAMAPSLSQISALMVDFAEHGESGRKAQTAVNGAFNAFLAPAADAAKAQATLNAAVADLPPSLDALYAKYKTGTLTTTEVTQATDAMTTTQATAFKAVTSATDAVQESGVALQKMGISVEGANGKLLPMSTILSELQQQIQGLPAPLAAAKLQADGFGTSAGKLVATIQAGSGAFNKDEALITRHNAAQIAAAKATSGMKDSFEKAKSAIEDAGIALGEKLMPYVTEAAQGVAKFAALIVKDWPQISAVFSVAFQVIRPIIQGFIDQMKGVIEVVSGLVEFIADVFTGKWGAAWDAIKKIFDGFVEFFKGSVERLFGWFTPYIEEGLKKVVSFFVAIPGEVESALASLVGLLTDIGESAINGLWNGIQNAWHTVENFFKGIYTDVKNWLADAGNWLIKIGEAIIDGLIKGIKAGFSKVESTIKGLGSDVVGWAKDAWGVLSPSKVFADIGGNLVAGLAQGITANSGLAHSAINNLTKGVTGNLALGVTGGVGAIASGSAGGGAVGATVVSQPITLTMNGQTVANTVLQIMLKNGRATGNVLGGYAGGNQAGTATRINTNAVSR